MALAAGPLIGGVLVQFGSWPAIFLVNLPVGLIAFVLAWLRLAESRNPTAQRIDLPGQLLVIADLTCLTLALIESSSLGWTSPSILGLLTGTVVLLAAFLFVEARTRDPLLPLSLFKSSVFSVANCAAFMSGFVSFGVIFFLAQFFQQVQGESVLEAGVMTLPISLGSLLTAPLAGMIAGRIGSRLPIIGGALLSGGAIFLLVGVEPSTGFASLWWILGLLGIGLALMISPTAAAVFSATPMQRAGLGSSMYNTSNRIGITVGIAALGSLVVQQFSSNITAQLTQRGVHAALAAKIAGKVAAAGGQASQSLHSGRLPLSPAIVHQTLSQAFTNALHGAFLLSAVILFGAALLVAIWYPQRQESPKTSSEPTETAMVEAVQAPAEVAV